MIQKLKNALILAEISSIVYFVDDFWNRLKKSCCHWSTFDESTNKFRELNFLLTILWK
jgi:hypothetical protein